MCASAIRLITDSDARRDSRRDGVGAKGFPRRRVDRRGARWRTVGKGVRSSWVARGVGVEPKGCSALDDCLFDCWESEDSGCSLFGILGLRLNAVKKRC